MNQKIFDKVGEGIIASITLYGMVVLLNASPREIAFIGMFYIFSHAMDNLLPPAKRDIPDERIKHEDQTDTC